MINYDNTTKAWKVFGIDIADAGLYDISIDVIDDFNTTYTGWTFTIDVVDPCLSSDFIIDPSIFQNENGAGLRLRHGSIY